MDVIQVFDILKEPVYRTVMAGSILICGMAALVGTFTFLRKRSLLGDVVSHAVLPGIVLAFMLSGTRYTIPLLIGGALSGALAAWLVEVVVKYSKLKTDAAIALNTSVFFGLGMTLLSVVQQSGSGNQSGLDRFLFGKAAAIQVQEVSVYFGVLVLISLVVWRYYRGFKMISFDESYAEALGFKTRWLRFILMMITVSVVAIGVQAVGVVLMTALLVSPAAIGRFMTSSLRPMLFIAGFSGMFAGAVGTAISYSRPSMPTGPWIVVVLSFMAFATFFMAPGKGVWRRFLQRKRNKRKIISENLIKSFYNMHDEGSAETIVAAEDLKQISGMRGAELEAAIKEARKQDWLHYAGKNKWVLTAKGAVACRSVVRKHRLWELYLSEYLNLASDHVHDNAEGIEHAITPEIEAELLLILDRPKHDPHNSEIPY